MEEKHVKTKTVIEQIYKNKKNKERIDNAAGGGGWQSISLFVFKDGKIFKNRWMKMFKNT